MIIDMFNAIITPYVGTSNGENIAEKNLATFVNVEELLSLLAMFSLLVNGVLSIVEAIGAVASLLVSQWVVASIFSLFKILFIIDCVFIVLF